MSFTDLDVLAHFPRFCGNLGWKTLLVMSDMMQWIEQTLRQTKNILERLNLIQISKFQVTTFVTRT